MRLGLPLSRSLPLVLAHCGSRARVLVACASSSSSTSSSAAAPVPAPAPYTKLCAKLQGIARLQRLGALANWDQLVMMPQNDANHAERGAQLAALAGVIHEQETSAELAALVEASEAEVAALGDRDAANLREARRDYDRLQRVPVELAERQASLSSEAYGVWAKARESGDWSAFAPTLAACFATAKEVAACRAPGADAYDECLQSFERGMSAARLDEVFGAARARLAPLIADCLASGYQPSRAPLSVEGAAGASFPAETQAALSRSIVEALGLDLSGGRLDLSVHPFSTSFGPRDVRITTRFAEDEWYQGLAGSMHEAGHSMYEAGLRDTALPVDTALSMGVHESQSLFWERHVGLSRPFWSFAGPRVRASLGLGASDDELYEAVNAVRRSLIRVEADELTYPMHVIVRYEIERDLVRGAIGVDAVPARWDAGMTELLGVAPPSDKEGCLQDVHWSSLAIGYFPTYLLGAMAAAQLWHHAKAQLPGLEAQIATGDFAPVKAWLGEKVHDQGTVHESMDALLIDAVGEPLNPEHFVSYLEEKYRKLYRL